MVQSTVRLRFASAISSAATTAEAVREVIPGLAQQMGGSADLVIFFATGHHRDGFSLIHAALRSSLGASVELGVTAEGVIGIEREIEEGPGLTVLAAQLPGALLQPFAIRDMDWSSTESLQQNVGPEGQPLRGLLMLADPFTVPINRLLGTVGELWPALPVVGGMASGGRQPGENRLMLNGQILHEGVVGVGLGGNIEMHTTVSQGCRAIGKPLVVTRCQRNVVQELGGRRALTAIEQLIHGLSDEDRELVRQNGLLVGRVIDEYKPRFGPGDFLIRNLVGIDEQTGAMALNDTHVRVGQTVQFHVRDQQTACDDFTLLLEAQKLHEAGGGGLLFSCNGRGTRLFEEKHQDASMVARALGPMPLAGFFAAGELGPVGQRNFVHGHTAILAVIRPLVLRDIAN